MGLFVHLMEAHQPMFLFFFFYIMMLIVDQQQHNMIVCQMQYGIFMEVSQLNYIMMGNGYFSQRMIIKIYGRELCT